MTDLLIDDEKQREMIMKNLRPQKLVAASKTKELPTSGDISVALTGIQMKATAGFFASAKLRENYSFHHLMAACRACGTVQKIEDAHVGAAAIGDFWEELFHSALTVAVLGVACLEAKANEIWFEGEAAKPALNVATANTLAEAADKQRTLDKFDLALAVRRNKRLARGAKRVQNVEDLIALRNAIVHFRPEWLGDPKGQHAKLSKRLAHRFAPSMFFPRDEPIFSRRWASASFAEWAIRSIVEFLDYFCAEAGIEDSLTAFKPRLSDLSGLKFE